MSSRSALRTKAGCGNRKGCAGKESAAGDCGHRTESVIGVRASGLLSQGTPVQPSCRKVCAINTAVHPDEEDAFVRRNALGHMRFAALLKPVRSDRQWHVCAADFGVHNHAGNDDCVVVLRMRVHFALKPRRHLYERTVRAVGHITISGAISSSPPVLALTPVGRYLSSVMGDVYRLERCGLHIIFS